MAFGKSFTFNDPSECGPIRDEALATPGPVVVEAVGDPFEPPMPPKISVEQSAKFAEALAKGTPNRAQIAWIVLSDKAPELNLRPRGSSKIPAKSIIIWQ